MAIQVPRKISLLLWWALRDRKGHKENKDLREKPVPLVHRDRKVNKVYKASKVLRVNKVRKENKARRVNKVCKAKPDSLRLSPPPRAGAVPR